MCNSIVNRSMRNPCSSSEPEPDRSIVRGSIDDYADRNPDPSEDAFVAQVSDTSLEAIAGRWHSSPAAAASPFAGRQWHSRLLDRQPDRSSGRGLFQPSPWCLPVCRHFSRSAKRHTDARAAEDRPHRCRGLAAEGRVSFAWRIGAIRNRLAITLRLIRIRGSMPFSQELSMVARECTLQELQIVFPECEAGLGATRFLSSIFLGVQSIPTAEASMQIVPRIGLTTRSARSSFPIVPTGSSDGWGVSGRGRDSEDQAVLASGGPQCTCGRAGGLVGRSESMCLW